MIETCFWISVAAIVYTYLGYPVLVWTAARFRERGIAKDGITPPVSVVIACHNEQGAIERRIKNLLDCDYPREALDIIVISDGSTDSTAEIAHRHSSRRVRVFSYKDQKGKAAALNLGVEKAKGDIIVFADARQSFEPDAIRELVANFADSRVGAASGELLLDSRDRASIGEGVGLYWKYEKWIRKSESRSGSTVGATGAIYAIRRELWSELPDNTILDDVYTPMRIALGGKRVVFDEKARAHDWAAESASREFSRKVRTLTGNYQLCQLMPRLLLPTSLLLFQFYSHKLMRLAAPLFFLLLFGASVGLATNPSSSVAQFFYQASLAAQLVFYAGVAAGWYLLKHNRKVRVLNLAYVFSLMNAAALVGLVFFVLGKRNIWARGE